MIVRLIFFYLKCFNAIYCYYVCDLFYLFRFTWSTTSEDRLNGLALLHIHKDININIDNIIIRFAKQKKKHILLLKLL